MPDITDVALATLGLFLGHLRSRVVGPGEGIGWFLSGGSNASGRALRVLGMLALIVRLAGGASPASAQEPPPPSHPAQPGHATPHGHDAAHGEHFHRNELALILAATYEEGEHDEEGETYFTVGGEYERRLTRAIGIGGEFEYVADADAWIFVAPISFRPVSGLRLFGGPGFERKAVGAEHGEHHEGDLDEGEGPRENLFLWRVGAGYGLEFAERYSFGPTVSFDFIRESGRWVNAIVYGIAFGIAF